jgi:hypothetical protein
MNETEYVYDKKYEQSYYEKFCGVILEKKNIKLPGYDRKLSSFRKVLMEMKQEDVQDILDTSRPESRYAYITIKGNDVTKIIQYAAYVGYILQPVMVDVLIIKSKNTGVKPNLSYSTKDHTLVVKTTEDDIKKILLSSDQTILSLPTKNLKNTVDITSEKAIPIGSSSVFSTASMAESNDTSSSIVSRANCCVCGVKFTSEIKCKTCSKCKVPPYCSVKCQTKDWPHHKLTCKKPILFTTSWNTMHTEVV